MRSRHKTPGSIDEEQASTLSPLTHSAGCCML
jgi:hypothetical protein